jgi:hypothetical protein
MLSKILLLATLLSTTTAHFLLDFPVSRPFDEDTLGTFPCGGQSKVAPSKPILSNLRSSSQSPVMYQFPDLSLT